MSSEIFHRKSVWILPELLRELPVNCRNSVHFAEKKKIDIWKIPILDNYVLVLNIPQHSKYRNTGTRNTGIPTITCRRRRRADREVKSLEEAVELAHSRAVKRSEAQGDVPLQSCRVGCRRRVRAFCPKRNSRRVVEFDQFPRFCLHDYK